MEIFALIAEVGAPIAVALVAGAFVFIIMKQIMGGVVGQIKTLEGFCSSLITRIKAMNNDMLKLDTSVSAALELTPDLDRLARAENFIEEGTIDARRDCSSPAVWLPRCGYGRFRLFRLFCLDYNNKSYKSSYKEYALYSYKAH